MRVSRNGLKKIEAKPVLGLDTTSRETAVCLTPIDMINTNDSAIRTNRRLYLNIFIRK